MMSPLQVIRAVSVREASAWSGAPGASQAV
jgi:hypothetical protein